MRTPARFHRPSLIAATLLLASGCGLSHSPAVSSSQAKLKPSKPYDVSVARRERITFTEEDREYAFAWHPDGQRLAYIGYRGPRGQHGIFIGELALQQGKPVAQRELIPAFDGGAPYGGVWSPDGKRFVYMSNRAGNYDIWVANDDGTQDARLTSDAADDIYPSWSPDGRRIAFLSTRSAEIAVWVMNRDGSQAEQITSGGNGDWGTAWSPDGRSILFGSIRRSAENKPKPEVLGRMHPLTKEELLAESVLLKNFFETVLLAGIPSENLWVVDLDTRALTQLTHGAGRESNWHPVWSPDGSKIAFVSDRGGSPDVWVMDADGSHQTQLTTEPTYDAFPVWSPDGTQLAYSSAENSKSNFDVWIMTLDKQER